MYSINFCINLTFSSSKFFSFARASVCELIEILFFYFFPIFGNEG